MARVFPGRTHYDGTSTIVVTDVGKIAEIKWKEHKDGSMAVAPDSETGYGVKRYMLIRGVGWWPMQEGEVIALPAEPVEPDEPEDDGDSAVLGKGILGKMILGKG